MGLRKNDLKDLVEKVFEIDSYASKMGEDENIITLAFSLKDKAAAEDLSGFFEKGYDYVIDADSTPGEQRDGTYKVFVELERERQSIDQIVELVQGLERLTSIRDFRFRYYKNFRSQEFNRENLESIIPTDPENYGVTVDKLKLENYENFFDKSYVDSISLKENWLTIKKKWADPLDFEFIDFGDAREIKESQTGTFDVLNSYPEIMYITKYIGDYAVSKYGNNLVLENGDKALVLRRLR
jgi:hypothetical protein